MNDDKNLSQSTNEQNTELFLTEIKKFNVLDKKIREDVELATKKCIYAAVGVIAFTLGSVGIGAISFSDRDFGIAPTILTVLGTLVSLGFTLKEMMNLIKGIAKESLLVSQLEKFIEEMDHCESQMQSDYVDNQEQKGMVR